MRGDVVLEDAELELSNAKLILKVPFDEAHPISLRGNTILRACSSRISAEPYQTYVDVQPLGDSAPRITSLHTDWLNHAGIRLYGASSFEAHGGEVAELQLHDQAQALVTGAYVYPVFFPGPGEFTLRGLTLGESVSVHVSGSTGWQFRATSCTITGYQLDLVEGSHAVIEDCEGLGISLHSRGKEVGQVQLRSITSERPQSRSFAAFGATLELRSSTLVTLNIYVVGTDSVLVQDCVVNEAQTDGESSLVIEGGTCYYNLVQARNRSRLELRDVGLARWPDGSGGSLLATDEAKITLYRCNVAGLTLTAIGSSAIQLVDCAGTDSCRIVEHDQGKVIRAPAL